MAKKVDFSDQLKKVKDKKIDTPKQKVVPIKGKKETLFSVYIPDDYLHKLKLKALNDKVSVKSLINQAIKDSYFSD